METSPGGSSGGRRFPAVARETETNRVSVPLGAVGSAYDAMDRAGYSPVLIGGLAARIRGFPEVTEDFYFMVSAATPAEKSAAVRLLHDHGFRVVIETHPTTGDVTRYIESKSEGAEYVEGSDPNVVFFWNPESAIRMDLLFDFPIPATELVLRAERIRIASVQSEIRVASVADLRRLYTTSYNYRRHPKDLRALEFLERLK